MAQKTMERKPPSFKIGDGMCTSKTNSPANGTSNGRPRYRFVHIECNNGHFLHIENQATGKDMLLQHEKDIILEPPIEFWNIDTQFSRAGKIY